MKAKTKLIIALVPTVILIVYGIEVGIRLLTAASGKVEYFAVAMVLLAVLLLVDLRLLGSYKRENK